ncbi:12767_t:CDS:10 [Ambispora leptoticha]|uniref:Ribosome biogenesis protein NOP53 n=1 Tax=Ambispora leptoticha TaxID=144679 RepID=A0A9N8ZZB0_9GLOM|nr:12767_t:CDS:10 [Ambispora leptoticha]
MFNGNLSEEITQKKPAAQPSRKGKKAWRKNVDITEVEQSLEEIRSEERTIGGRLRDQFNEHLFVVDTVGDLNVKQKIKKVLRIDEILSSRSKIPAVASRTSNLRKTEKRQASRAENARLEQMVRRKRHLRMTNDLGSSEAVKRAGTYDVWEEQEDSQDAHDFINPAKRRKTKAPETLQKKPATKVVPVHIPHPGASYNPTFEDHQKLLYIANEEEIRKEEESKKLQEKLPKYTDAPTSELNPQDMIDRNLLGSDNEEDSVEENEENQDVTVKNKSKNDSNVRSFYLDRLPEIIQSVEKELSEREKKAIEKAKLAEEKIGMPLKKIGKYPVTKLPIDIQLYGELSESLRTLKPEGNLFRDRIASLEERNIIEPRVPVFFCISNSGFVLSSADNIEKPVETVTESISNLNLNASPQPPQQPPSLSQQNVNNFLLPEYKDITTFLDEVTQEFQIGQLIHLESFGLYDAMSSIEIMDPKMDSGMILDSDLTKKPFILNARLTPRQALGVIDRLFSCEMTWHSGHSLSQTLYTCMYLHHVLELKPELFSNEGDHEETSSDVPIEFVILVLKAYILGTAKCCNFVLEEMIKGNVYEEEDFATNKFALNLYEDFSESTAVNLLDDAESWLDQKGGSWLLENEPEKCEILYHALKSRLQLRKSFLLALIHLAKPRCQQYTESQRHLLTTLQILNGTNSEPGIKSTIELGVDVDGAFDPLINRKLVSQTPPRPIRLLTMQQSLEELNNLLENTLLICGITEYKSADILMNFFYYNAARQPPACAYSRSLLQSTFCTENRILGKFSVFQLIKDSVTEISNPPYVYFASRSDTDKPTNGAIVDETKAKISHLVNKFLESAVKPLTDIFRILCHNRSRQRRNMCKVLTDWDLLQEEAEHIDGELHILMKEEPIMTEDGPSHSYYLSSWVYHRKLILLQEILFLGFELGLYGNHEFIMIYWYVDYLLGVHYQHLERMLLHITTKPSATNKESRKTKKQKALQATPPVTPSFTLIISKKSIITVRQEICRGIYRQTIAALQKTGHFKIPQLEYDNEGIRFWQRFRMYRNLGSPTLLTYREFKENTKFDNLTKNYETAKTAIDHLMKMKLSESRMDLCETDFKNDLKAMLRVCIANIVGLQKMLQDPEVLNQRKEALASRKQNQKQPQSSLPSSSSNASSTINIATSEPKSSRTKYVDFEFKYHPWYPVISLLP